MQNSQTLRRFGRGCRRGRRRDVGRRRGGDAGPASPPEVAASPRLARSRLRLRAGLGLPARGGTCVGDRRGLAAQRAGALARRRPHAPCARRAARSGLPRRPSSAAASGVRRRPSAWPPASRPASSRRAASASTRARDRPEPPSSAVLARTTKPDADRGVDRHEQDRVQPALARLARARGSDRRLRGGRALAGAPGLRDGRSPSRRPRARSCGRAQAARRGRARRRWPPRRRWRTRAPRPSHEPRAARPRPRDQSRPCRRSTRRTRARRHDAVAVADERVTVAVPCALAGASSPSQPRPSSSSSHSGSSALARQRSTLGSSGSGAAAAQARARRASGDSVVRHCSHASRVSGGALSTPSQPRSSSQPSTSDGGGSKRPRWRAATTGAAAPRGRPGRAERRPCGA